MGNLLFCACGAGWHRAAGWEAAFALWNVWSQAKRQGDTAAIRPSEGVRTRARSVPVRIGTCWLLWLADRRKQGRMASRGGLESRLRTLECVVSGQAPGGHCCDRSEAKEFGLEPAVSPSAPGAGWKFPILLTARRGSLARKPVPLGQGEVCAGSQIEGIKVAALILGKGCGSDHGRVVS